MEISSKSVERGVIKRRNRLLIFVQSDEEIKKLPRVGRVDPVKPAHELQVGRLCPALLLPTSGREMQPGGLQTTGAYRRPV